MSSYQMKKLPRASSMEQTLRESIPSKMEPWRHSHLEPSSANVRISDFLNMQKLPMMPNNYELKKKRIIKRKPVNVFDRLSRVKKTTKVPLEPIKVPKRREKPSLPRNG